MNPLARIILVLILASALAPVHAQQVGSSTQKSDTVKAPRPNKERPPLPPPPPPPPMPPRN